jgi:hypothetical protein
MHKFSNKMLWNSEASNREMANILILISQSNVDLTNESLSGIWSKDLTFAISKL